MNDYGSLIELQAIDLSLDKQESLVEEILTELTDRTALDELELKQLAVENELSKLAKKQGHLQLELNESKDRISSLSERMYAGTLRNEKELKSVQEEITFLEGVYKEKEENILELMLKAESYSSLGLSITEKLRIDTGKAQERQGSLQAQKHDLEITIATQREQRNKIVKNITKTLLDSYTQIRTKKGGIAVSQLSRDMCGVCRIVIPSSELQQMKRSKEWRKCSGCGRMIVAG